MLNSSIQKICLRVTDINQAFVNFLLNVKICYNEKMCQVKLFFKTATCVLVLTLSTLTGSENGNQTSAGSTLLN